MYLFGPKILTMYRSVTKTLAMFLVPPLNSYDWLTISTKFSLLIIKMLSFSPIIVIRVNVIQAVATPLTLATNIDHVV